MTLNTLNYLRFIQVIIALCAGGAGILNWSIIPKPLRIFSALLIISGVTEVLTFVLYKIGINPNTAVYIYEIIEITFIAWFYISIFNKRRIRFIITLTALGLTLFFIINWVFIQRANLNSYSIGLQYFAKLTLGLYFFYHLLEALPNLEISKDGVFWINVGTVLHAAGALFLFLLADYLINVLKNDMIVFASVNNILMVIANAIYLVGMWYGIREGKIKQESI